MTTVLPQELLDQVLLVLNQAADAVLDEVGAPDTGARDIVNLVVNVFGARIKGDDTSTIADIIEDGYEASPDEVLSWCVTS